MKAFKDFLNPGGSFSRRQFFMANLLCFALVILSAKIIKNCEMRDPRPAIVLLIVGFNSLYGIASSKRFRGLGQSAWWGMTASAAPLVGLLLLSTPDRENRIY